jgi:FMN reductase
MVLDFAMRPLFTYLRTRIAATAVFAGPQDWGNADDGGSPLSARIDRAAGEFIGLLQGTQSQQKPAPLESLPFEQLLAGISGGR